MRSTGADPETPLTPLRRIQGGEKRTDQPDKTACTKPILPSTLKNASTNNSELLKRNENWHEGMANGESSSENEDDSDTEPEHTKCHRPGPRWENLVEKRGGRGEGETETAEGEKNKRMKLET